VNIMGMVLPLIGNFVVKQAKKVVGENLKVSRSLEPYMGTGSSPLAGMMKGLVGNVMSGGMGALMENPVGALTGAIGGQLGGLTDQLANVQGAGGLQSAISGDLGAALERMGGHTDMMTGQSQATENGFGPMQILGHAAMLDSPFDLPDHIGMDSVLGPLAAGDLMGSIQSGLPALVAKVVAGGDPGLAAAQVRAWAGTMNGLVDGSVNALRGGQDAMATMSNAASIVDEVANPANAYSRAYLGLTVRPEVADTVAQAKAEAAEAARVKAAAVAQQQAQEEALRIALLAAIEAAGIHDPEDEDGEG
jgi:hypothetical protein